MIIITPLSCFDTRINDLSDYVVVLLLIVSKRVFDRSIDNVNDTPRVHKSPKDQNEIGLCFTPDGEHGRHHFVEDESGNSAGKLVHPIVVGIIMYQTMQGNRSHIKVSANHVLLGRLSRSSRKCALDPAEHQLMDKMTA